LLAVVFVIL